MGSFHLGIMWYGADHSLDNSHGEKDSPEGKIITVSNAGNSLSHSHKENPKRKNNLRVTRVTSTPFSQREKEKNK